MTLAEERELVLNYPEDKPFREHPAHKFLMGEEIASESRSKATIGDFWSYMDLIGCGAERAYDVTSYVFEDYHRNYLPDRTTRPLHEWLSPAPTEGGQAYSLHGAKTPLDARYAPTVALMVNLEERFSSLVYPFHQDNYYFEVINNRLFIKYQVIIGGRLVANLEAT